jgi:phosphomannomutase
MFLNNSDIITQYISEICIRFKGLKGNKKIIFDSGQTVATPIIQEVLSRLTLNFKLLTEPRGLNPLLEEGYKNVCDMVVKEKADLGVLWDGDCDRVVFIDRSGKLIPQSYILGIIAKNYQKAAFDIRAGLAAYTTDYIITQSWAQNLKYAMQEDPKIGFAGEVSGHLIFREWYGIDDGIFGALKFIELMGDVDSQLSILKNSYLEMVEQNFEYKSDPALVLDKISNYYRSRDFSVSVMDGVTVASGEFHFNIRQSLTEPFLRLNLEARSQGRLDELYEEIRSQIE